MKIKEWILKHDVDWKWLIILVLLLHKSKSFLVEQLMWFAVFISSFSSYPEKIDMDYQELGNTISNILMDALKSVIENGYRWGAKVYPYNSLIAKIISYLPTIFSFGLIILLISLMTIILLNFYWKNKK